MRLTRRTLDLYASPIAEAHAHLAHRAGSRPLLDLSQAAPGYPTAPVVQERIAQVAAEPDGGRYAPPPGMPGLKAAFAAELSRDHDAAIDPSNVLPCGGCNQAFCIVTSALTEPGDEVILVLPYYFNHDMWLKLDGVTPRYLEPGPGLIPSAADARQLINNRTRAIVLVTPGNPSGVTLLPESLSEFFDLAVSADIALIIDETYRSFRPTQDASHDLYSRPKWEDHLITLHSFSKDLAIPGYRVGAVVGGGPIIYEAMKLLDCVQICAPRISQEAVVAGLTRATEWRRTQAERIERAHKAFTEVMVAKPGGFELVSSGAFFGWVRHALETSSAEVVKRLVIDHDVLVIPGTAFTPEDRSMLRFSFANLDNDEIAELGKRLAEVIR